jgi:hypothetical protein
MTGIMTLQSLGVLCHTCKLFCFVPGCIAIGTYPVGILVSVLIGWVSWVILYNDSIIEVRVSRGMLCSSFVLLFRWLDTPGALLSYLCSTKLEKKKKSPMQARV